ncbi:MAG: SPOR domain-containing protein [Deltaproteobacteria bacterium]|nr:SPOR domain-containing protein [Deltaproteobacteria bacterium]
MGEAQGNIRSTAVLTVISALVGAAVVLGAYFLLRAPAPEDASGPIVVSKRVKIDLKAFDARPVETANAPVEQKEAPSDEPEAKDEEKPAKREQAMDAKAKATLVIDKVKKEVEESGQAPKAEKAAKKKEAPKPRKKELALLLKQPWVVNVASFSTSSEAAGLSSRLAEAGFNAYLTEFTKDGKKWHRVRVGFYSAKRGAVQASKAIATKHRVKSPWVAKAAREEIIKNAK